MRLGFWRLVREAAIGWWIDRATSLGAAIAFYTVFSLAPMLLIVIAVAGLVFGREAAQGAIVSELGGMLGKTSAALIETMIASASNVQAGTFGTIVGVVTFLVLVTGAVLELQDDLNQIWKVSATDSYGLSQLIRTRLLSIALVIGFGFLLLVSLLLDAGLSALGAYLEAGFSGATFILKTLNAGASFLIAVLLFAMIYKILPAVDLTWRDVAVGALVTGVLFTLGKILIGWYLGTSGVASTYGAAASLITILLWIYYSSLILLFGAEFTKAYAELRGSRKNLGRIRSAPADPEPDVPSRHGPPRAKRGGVTEPSGSSGAGHRR